jgi:hypothetical protein
LGERVEAVDARQQSAMTKTFFDQARFHGDATEPSSAAPTNGAAALAHSDAPRETLEERRAKVEEHRAERARALDEYLSTEHVDKAWSDAMVAAAYRVVDAAKTTHLIKAECASHLCRVVVDHPDVTEQRAFAASISQTSPFDNGIFFRYDKSSPRPQTTLYIAREGTELGKLISAP